MKPHKIPVELRELDQWVCWKAVTRIDRPTKVPFQPNGLEAKSNDRQTWHTFDEAVAASERFDGIGFVFSEDDEFLGVDFDGCRSHDGTVADWARNWITQLASYAEVSPSETGFKVIVRARNPRSTGKACDVGEPVVSDKTPGVEVYDRLRYFAITSQRVAGLPSGIESRQDVVNDLVEHFFPLNLPNIQSDSSSSTPVVERARKYLSRIPGAVSGQKGHNQTFHAACVLVLGFGLSTSEALHLLSDWNATCKPPWSEKELRHKVDGAAKQSGPRNYLRDVQPSQWCNVNVPDYKAKTAELLTLEDSANLYLRHLETGQQLVDLGIADVDYALGGGVAFGEMVVVAARPSHGKSAIALQCLDTATRSGMAGLLISEEMSSLAIGKRTIQFATEAAEEHWKTSLTEVRSDLSTHFGRREQCYLVEGCRSVDRVGEVVEYAVQEHGVKVVAVDYAQLLSAKGGNRYEQITNTSIALRRMANAHKIVLIVLAQLSRSIESRDKFIPKISDLKDSGQLEQDADVVMFLVWPHRVDSKVDPQEYQVYIAKNRNRAINQPVVHCRFFPSRQMVLHSKAENHTPEFDDWNSRIP